MDYKIVYRDDCGVYSTVNLLDGSKGTSYSLSNNQNTVYINKNFNSTNAKYTVLMKIGLKKVLCIDTQGELHIMPITKLDYTEVSNNVTTLNLACTSKLVVKCKDRYIELPFLLEKFYLVTLAIHLYNSKYTAKVDTKYNGHFIGYCSVNTYFTTKSSKYVGIHCIGNIVFVRHYKYESEATSDEIRNAAASYIVELDNSSIYPISRVIEDNVYYNVIDTQAILYGNIKQHIIKMSIQELAKRIDRTTRVKRHNDILKVKGLDGYYRYNLTEISNIFNIELIPDMRTTSRRMLGIGIDDVILNSNGELERIQTKSNTLHIPVECKSLLKDSVCVGMNVRYVHIPNSVKEIKSHSIRFIGSNVRTSINIVIDNNANLEILNLLKEINRGYYVTIQVKNKTIRYKELEYIVQNTKGVIEVEEKLSETEVRAFLKELSIKKFDSFKGLESWAKLGELNSNWSKYNSMYELYNISDTTAHAFIRQYVEYIDKRIRESYSKYKTYYDG